MFLLVSVRHFGAHPDVSDDVVNMHEHFYANNYAGAIPIY